jgi:hypothetical protein
MLSHVDLPAHCLAIWTLPVSRSGRSPAFRSDQTLRGFVRVLCESSNQAGVHAWLDVCRSNWFTHMHAGAKAEDMHAENQACNFASTPRLAIANFMWLTRVRIWCNSPRSLLDEDEDLPEVCSSRSDRSVEFRKAPTANVTVLFLPEFAGSVVFGRAHPCFYSGRLVLEGAVRSSSLRWHQETFWSMMQSDEGNNMKVGAED